LWDVTNPGGKPVLLTGHADQVRAVAFSPVDSLLASASDDSTVRLWDTKHLSAQPIILRGHEGGITSVVFSRDGRFLASGGEDGTARIWIAQTAMLADKVCEKVGRNLTLDEWQRFVGKDLDYEKTCDNLPGPLAVAGSEASLRPAAQLSSVVAAYPPDKTVFRHYPRTVSLRWSVLPGAAAYTVEVEFCQTPACERPAH
jgi:WD40 repeat protein